MSLSDPTYESTEDISQIEETAVDELSSLEEIKTVEGEPTLGGEQVLEAKEEIPPQKVPTFIPKGPYIPIAKRLVSGRYRGTLGFFQLELRVDVDRTKPMKRVSGDFYQFRGNTVSYFGSFVVNSPLITITETQVIIKGLGNFTFSAGASFIKVTIPRRIIILPQAPATLQFFTTSGSAGAVYNCQFESAFFRTVKIETDRTSDVTTPILNTYNTGSLPSGGPARILNVVSAYAEAGIEMIPTTGSNVIDVLKEAGPEASWSDAELHAAMVKHFSLWKDIPQWAVWLIVAQKHDYGSGLYGIMFDQAGKQRQGCAVFHTGIGGTTAEKMRLQLYTYVHELGHCFNLLHSWQKMYAQPPHPNRPCAISWMNYPWNYPSCNNEPAGAATFWKRFPFQFDNEEIIHLRHAFRNNIIMGSNNFIIGSSLGREIMADSIRDVSGLTLNISTHQKSFALGEPVVLEIELGTTDTRGQHVHKWLHPNCGLVKIVLQKPNGEVVAYEPLIDHLVGEQEKILSKDETIKESAYIGFGKGGLYFDIPGRYKVRAAYAALDGSEILSEIINIRVRYPISKEEDNLADLLIGEEQGTLFYLLGSDSEALHRGNDAFNEILEKYPKHRITNYIRLVKGTNAGRAFKIVTEEKETRLKVREANPEESAHLLTIARESNVLDPVTTNMVLENLAGIQAKMGDEMGAKKTQDILSAKKEENLS